MNMNREAGFTLLETLIALTIFTFAATSFYQGLGLGARGLRAAQFDMAALTIARSQLASAGTETPLVAGTTTGITQDGLSWSTEARAYSSDSAPALSEPPGAYWITVRVEWREGPARRVQSLELKTLKLAGAS